LLANGRVKVTHFAHKPGTNCNPDRVTHALAQHKIVEAVRSWKDGTGDVPKVVYRCEDCWQTCVWPIPEIVSDAKLEFWVEHQEKKYRLDIALFPFDDTKLGVEVHQTNYVEAQKEADLAGAGIIHFEVEAREIIDRPAIWRIINCPPGFDLCNDCRKARVPTKDVESEVKSEALQDGKDSDSVSLTTSETDQASTVDDTLPTKPIESLFARSSPATTQRQRPQASIDYLERYRNEAFSLALRLGIRLPRGFYRYQIVECWKCHNEILVYTWPGKRKWESRRPNCNHESMPKTIQEVTNKKTRRFYWANTCPVCESVQGDEHIHFHVTPQWDSPQAFIQDLREIATAYFSPKGALW